MHEFALVRSLLEQVSQIVEADGGGSVQQVRVRCGPLAGVEPMLMQEAFTLLRSGSAFADAELLIVEEPLQARCRQCDQEFEPQQFRFHCPECGSPHTITESGDAVMIESVVVESLSAESTTAKASPEFANSNVREAGDDQDNGPVTS